MTSLQTICQESNTGSNKQAALALSSSNREILITGSNDLMIYKRREKAQLSGLVENDVLGLKTKLFGDFDERCLLKFLDTEKAIVKSTCNKILTKTTQRKNRHKIKPGHSTKISRNFKTTSSAKRSSRFLHLFVVMCTMLTRIDCYVNVEWNLKNKPAILGENVTLECKILDDELECSKYTRQWYGGRSYGLLCQNGMCRNEAKYDELKINACTFELVITKFDVDDLDQEYSCSYGISNDRKILQINEMEFVGKPASDDQIGNITYLNGTLSAELRMQNVYPKPQCFMLLTFMTKSIAKWINQSNSSFAKTGQLYSGNVTFYVNHPITDCIREVNVSCLFGSTESNILKTTLRQCSDVSYNINMTNTTHTHIAVILSVCTFVVVIVAILVKWAGKWSKCKVQRTQKVPRDSGNDGDDEYL